MKGTERCLWKPSQQDINNSNMEAGKEYYRKRGTECAKVKSRFCFNSEWLEHTTPNRQQ